MYNEFSKTEKEIYENIMTLAALLTKLDQKESEYLDLQSILNAYRLEVIRNRFSDEVMRALKTPKKVGGKNSSKVEFSKDIETLNLLKHLPAKKTYSLHTGCSQIQPQKNESLRIGRYTSSIDGSYIEPTPFMINFLEKTTECTFENNQKSNITISKMGLLNIIIKLEQTLIEKSKIYDINRIRVLRETGTIINAIWDKEDEIDNIEYEIKKIISTLSPIDNKSYIEENIAEANRIVMSFNNDPITTIQIIKNNLDAHSKKIIVKIKSLFAKKPKN